MTCSQRKGQQQSIYTTLYTIYYPLYQQKPEPVQQKKRICRYNKKKRIYKLSADNQTWTDNLMITNQLHHLCAMSATVFTVFMFINEPQHIHQLSYE